MGCNCVYSVFIHLHLARRQVLTCSSAISSFTRALHLARRRTESSRALLPSVHLLGLNGLQLHLLGLYSFTLSTKTDPVLPFTALRPAIRPRGLSAVSSVIQALLLARRQTEVWAATGQRY